MDLNDGWRRAELPVLPGVTWLGWSVAGLGMVVLIAALVLPGNVGFAGIIGDAHGERGQLNAIAAIAGGFGYLAGIVLLGLAWVLRGEFGLD